MDQQTMLIFIVALVVLGGVAVWLTMQRRRSDRLRAQYGPEYERVVRESGDRRRAEAELEHRAERVEQLHIRPLEEDERARFAELWRADQARFVDDPKGAVTEADRLVADLMIARGYPVADFQQRAADISVDHPRVVENYRAARDIAVRHQRGEASTEDLRQAMVYYRGLFSELLEQRAPEGAEARP
ncbi:MAG TPA: hypothetical protein VJ803_05660 [Gemmatimonadaceae bacterium]|nr:hypothetical protein [Gemmatimonadaceae bacterium]